MKLFLAVLCLSLAVFAAADTGDKLITGDLVVNGTIRVDTSLTGDGLLLGIDSTKIAALAVDSEKVAAGAINTTKLAQITSSDSGKVMCMMPDATIGQCKTSITNVSCLCEAFQ